MVLQGLLFFSLKAFGPSRLLASFAEALNLPQAGKAVSIFGFGAFSYLWFSREWRNGVGFRV